MPTFAKFMWLSKYFIFVFIALSFSIKAQLSDSLSLSAIKFSGLKKTNVSVVSRLMYSKVGDKLSSDNINNDAQALRNFPGIGEVKYNLDTVGRQVSVTYQISEVKTLLPVLNFGGIQGNIWFQIGLADINWLGKGNHLSAYYQNSDRRHSGHLYYKVPRIGDYKWGYSITFSRWASQEPLYFPNNVIVQYHYDYNNAGISSIYQFNLRRKVELGASYFVEKYKKLADELLPSQPGPNQLRQPKVLGKLSYTEDYVNYFYYMQQGLTWQALYQYVFNFDDKSTFNSLIVQARYYAMLQKEVNLAIRATFGISTNNNTPFAPFVVDSHVNLRGVGNRIERGTAQLVLNAEVRKTIIDKKNWASQLVVFSDAGTWRTPGGSISEFIETRQFRQFAGGGIRVIYKKIHNAILRMDYGVDLYNPNQNGLVIGFGQYF